jgi:hypothetical protein
LWRAGFAPVIEHERPGQLALRPASEELLMSMLGFGMGFAAFDRRFAHATSTGIGRSTADRATVQVTYDQGSRPDEVFTIENGRITSVADGTFRTAFGYDALADGLSLAKVTRTAIAAVGADTPTEVVMEFTEFAEVAGARVATRARFAVSRPDATVRFTSRLTKCRGNGSVPADDVAASYAAWAERALRRAHDAGCAVGADDLASLHVGELHMTITTGGEPTHASGSATWRDGDAALDCPALSDPFAADVTAALRHVTGLGTWQQRFDGANFELLAAPDPQRRMQIAVTSPALPAGTVVMVEEGRLTSIVSAAASSAFRYDTADGALRLVGIDDRDGARDRRTSFSQFERFDGIWLPTRMRVTTTAPGVAETAVDVGLREMRVDR